MSLEIKKEEAEEVVQAEQIRIKEETIRKLRQLKGTKAPGESGIKNEAW